MRRSLLFACSLLLVLGVSGVPPVAGHTLAGETNVTRQRLPVGKVDPGKRVIVYGRVKATESTCYEGGLVELVRRQAGQPDRVVARESLDAQGRYWFIRRPRRDLELYVRFNGSEVVTPDHSHICTGSASRSVKFRIVR